MTIPTIPHYMNLYEKQTTTNKRFIARYPVYDYKHKITATGWFDTASFSIRLAPSLAEIALDGTSGWLGNRIAIFVDDPNVPIWEGFINSMEVGRGNRVQRISLDEMYNRVSASRTQRTAGTSTVLNSLEVNTAANQTASQAVYGIKAGNVETYMSYNADNTKYNAVRDMTLARQAWPQATYSEGNLERGVVYLECLGFYHTLEWDNYIQNPAGAANEGLSVALTTIVGAIANGTTFFNNADTTEIGTNVAVLTRRFGRGQQTVWQWLQTLQEAGDGTNYWIMGISPPRYPDIGGLFGGFPTRRLYYRAFNLAVEYTARLIDDLRPRNQYGKLIRPWMVTPDKVVRIVDELINWDGTGDDPREFYVEYIEYEANSKRAVLYGNENKTIEGAMRFHRLNNINGKRFGAPLRIYEGAT